MREFTDDDGRRWVATVARDDGPDYKGRYYLVMRPADEEEADGLALDEIRWNSEPTAERTLRTMHELELRRRLRYALNRHDRTPSGTP